MKPARRNFLQLAAGAAALPPLSRVTGAQSYPSRPITMIVPFPPGGPVDTLGRIVGERIRIALGQPVIVENVSGASGSLGVGRVARAAPDGYTLGMGNWTSHVGSPAMYPIQYDIVTDFEPVALLPISPTLIIARKGLPANDLKELIAWLRAHPSQATAGTVGAGSPSHISGIYFQHETGTRLQYVPYRGGAPLTQALVAGQVDIRVGAEASQTLSYLRSGEIKAFAVLDKTRWAAAPDIPTIDEAGVRGFHLPLWNGLWVPKGTPKDLVGRLNAAIADALADAALRQRIANFGFEIPAREQQTPEALAAFHRAEIGKWWPIIKAAGTKPSQ
jgi:tripartite-type tricarboxylate transporter receptor subunit TctC